MFRRHKLRELQVVPKALLRIRMRIKRSWNQSLISDLVLQFPLEIKDTCKKETVFVLKICYFCVFRVVQEARA